MGEANRKRHLLAEGLRHVPSEGMMNVSGKMVHDLGMGVMDMLKEPFSKGMQADVAAQVLMACAVDLWRANYGDQHCIEVFGAMIGNRMSRPKEYWGIQRVQP